MRNESFPFPELRGIEGKHLLIALSGGADSVALLLLLNERRKDMKLTLSCAHMDHGIRPESGEDAGFCRELCKSLGIPLHLEKTDIPAIAKETGEGLETCARRVRYQFLRRTKEDIGADLIALAHHMDDQAETVLMHLFRGTGPEGITGMKTLSGDLFRPLIGIRKQQLISYVSGLGYAWREDGTNRIADTPRNALRLNVIPEIEKSYAGAVNAVARFARASAIENEFLARLTDNYIGSNLVQGPFGTLLKLSEDREDAIVRRAIRRICGPDLDHEKLVELAALCESSRGKTDISSKIFAERGRLGLYFLPKTQVQISETPLCINGITEIPGFCIIEAKSAPPVPVKDDPLHQVLRKITLEGAVVRTRRDGDRIRPLGSGEKLLSDYFTDKKIDRPLRDFIPLIAKGENILWAAGVGISGNACIQSPADECISLTIKHKFSL